MNCLQSKIIRLYSLGANLADRFQPLFLLLVRLYMSRVFFLSGLTKIRDWETTIALFTDEYHVPLLSPEVAAAAGATGELVLPILLTLGLGGRFAAAGLFVVNLIAVLSYPDIAEAAKMEHFYWGTAFVMLVVFGPGRYAVDAFIKARLGNKA